MKGYVERLVKTYQTECVLLEHPETEEAAREVTEAFLKHYHAERPHQGRGLGNRPPLVAFPGYGNENCEKQPCEPRT